MKQVTAVVLGAGDRGGTAYAPYALKSPHKFKIVAVADIDKKKRENFKKLYDLSDDMIFENAEKLFEREKLADCILICTQDGQHHKHAIEGLKKGYHMLLEKPMAVTFEQCIDIANEAKNQDRILSICHVLRYTPFFVAIKELLAKKEIGQIISIQHNENVANWHYAHSYIRGNWRNSSTSSPMILAKSCHDMDIISWLVDSKCKKISSFGSLTHFKLENAPEHVPERCISGCPIETECPYYAPDIYLTENLGWPTSTISSDSSLEARRKVLMETSFGKCVYKCDNNVVDHQVVNIEFENEVTVAFTMCAFTNDCSRTIKIMGSKGEIRGHMEKNEIEIIYFNTGRKDLITVNPNDGHVGHGGGDFGLISNFVNLLAMKGKIENKTSADISLQSHLMAFAAEKSRLDGVVIDFKEFSISSRQQT